MMRDAITRRRLSCGWLADASLPWPRLWASSSAYWPVAARSICSAGTAFVNTEGGPTSTPSRASALPTPAAAAPAPSRRRKSLRSRSTSVTAGIGIAVEKIDRSAQHGEQRQRRQRDDDRDEEERRPADRLREDAGERPDPDAADRRERAQERELRRAEAPRAQAHQEGDERGRPHSARDVLARDRHQEAAVDRRRLGELDEAPVERRQHEPGERVTAVQGEPPEAEVAEHLQDAEQHQRAPQAKPHHERAADERAADREPQADHLVDDTDLGGAVVHRLQ